MAVQREDGSRVQGEFSPGTALWEVLTGVGMASREGEKEPLVMYMGHKVPWQAVCRVISQNSEWQTRVGLTQCVCYIPMYCMIGPGTTVLVNGPGKMGTCTK